MNLWSIFNRTPYNIPKKNYYIIHDIVVNKVCQHLIGTQLLGKG